MCLAELGIVLLAHEDAATTSPLLWIALGAIAGAAIAWWLKPAATVREVVPPSAPARPSGAPLRLLNVLQREGRLLDFLKEDLAGLDDATIGAAVRDIHRSCGKALDEHLVLEPIFAQPEDAAVTVPAGFDPSAIRVTGNVTGQPPFQGALRHHGWRVREIKLPTPASGIDEFVIQPAEVELA